MRVRKSSGHEHVRDLLAEALANAEFDLKEALVEARASAGLTQRDVADRIGVKESAIVRFERLDSDPALSMIRHYAHAVGFVVDYRVDRDPDRWG